MPPAEHLFYGSWGYQVKQLFCADFALRRAPRFMYLVDYLHQKGIGVFIDWVPAHFPKDSVGLETFDGTELYSHKHPFEGEHPDWHTRIFNYGRNENKRVSA